MYGSEHQNGNYKEQIDQKENQKKSELKSEMKNINFPLNFEQIQKRENIDITNKFVERVCKINNHEPILDDKFKKIWKEFYKNSKDKFKGGNYKIIFREDWQYI